jgi:glycosyltransferase involved in cell wall biosynthesis
MKILLIGNFPYLYSQSMNRFADLMEGELKHLDHEVRLLKPTPFLGKLCPSAYGMGKWFGYIDRFLLFIPNLLHAAAWADVIHICDQANAVYVPWIYRKPHLVTCHDMIAIRSALGEIPEHPTCWTGRIYQLWIGSGLRRAQRIICVSNHTQRELHRTVRIPIAKTAVVENALNYPYHPVSRYEIERVILSRYPLHGASYFLHIGGNHWYKNREGVVHLFANLINLKAFRNHHLILAGDKWASELSNLVGYLNLQNRIHQWTEASNEDLQGLYSGAEALLFPSYMEGFGWPIIEAQTCGCPVITTGLEPMTDVGGNSAIYIDPHLLDDAADLIGRRLPKDRDLLVQDGFRNAARFSSEKMINGYLEAYEIVRSSCIRN